jgi:hypothetical protein
MVEKRIDGIRVNRDDVPVYETLMPDSVVRGVLRDADLFWDETTKTIAFKVPEEKQLTAKVLAKAIEKLDGEYIRMNFAQTSVSEPQDGVVLVRFHGDGLGGIMRHLESIENLVGHGKLLKGYKGLGDGTAADATVADISDFEGRMRALLGRPWGKDSRSGLEHGGVTPFEAKVYEAVFKEHNFRNYAYVEKTQTMQTSRAIEREVLQKMGMDLRVLGEGVARGTAN